MVRVFTLVTGLVLPTTLMAACQQNGSSLVATDADYAAVDAYSIGIHESMKVQSSDKTYLSRVNQGLTVSPMKYLDVVLTAAYDGQYKMGNLVFENVVGSALKAPNLKQNLQDFNKRYSSMTKLFASVNLDRGTNLSAADIQHYFRFTRDFLANGGFRGNKDALNRKYRFEDYVRAMRTGIFVTQLPMIDGKPGAKAFALVGGGNNGSGVGAVAATDMAASFSATKYDATSANGCSEFNAGGARAAENHRCISVSDTSPLWQQLGGKRCTQGGMQCGSEPCGKNVNIVGPSGVKVIAKVCGACPADHPENTAKGKDNPCANGTNHIDMAAGGVFEDAGFNPANQYQNSGDHGAGMQVSVAD